MFRVFYQCYSTDAGIESNAAEPIDQADIPALIDRHLLHVDDFIGLVDPQETTLQMIRGASDRVWLEIPSPTLQGSFGQHMRLDEAKQLVLTVQPPLQTLQDRFDFVSWNDPAQPQPFPITKEQIEPIATGHGGGIATSLVMRADRGIRYFYREEPDNELDSGWRFLSGFEDDEYMNEPSNHGIYDVNTIANLEPSIVPLLDSLVGSAFERQHIADDFVAVVD